LNKREKQKYKKKLLEKKQEIIRALSDFYNESKEVEDPAVAKDTGDKAESSYTKEFLLSLSNAERQQLLMTDAALRRIEECTYGTCQMCGNPIGTKRLDAIPWASYCIHCQEKAEQES